MFDGAAGGAHAAPAKGPDSGFQLLQAEGLGHVIVGTVVEPAHALVDTVGGRQNQHGQGRQAFAQPVKHVHATNFRQAQVQHHTVKACGLQALLSFFTIAGGRDAMAGLR